ncbi:hypothetical protein [Congregibacter litoralis]|uniref:Lipoprotein n=1 Tax=Congregibacter litoralis KT71 TaxID=314285 RepID=A4ADP5_9GAMM|nr:hypothetical protein [Congregibacter litoralis]EAQ95853.2 hypothetical protein KT71_18406 [Congregibacter litoralis KT71]
MTTLGRRPFVALLFGSMLGGCGGYEVKNLVKSDIDLVTDEFITETRLLVRELMAKFYARNPDQLRRGALSTADDRLRQLRDTPGPLAFEELGYAQEIAALELVFQESFHGDRVFALIVGLGGMLRRAYGYNTESFLFDSLDSRALSTSARNIEILLWRLKNNRQSTGAPFLISSEYQGRIDNLSFERVFGKLIALQDMMSRIAGDAGDRRVTKVVHTATSVFIPLPI